MMKISNRLILYLAISIGALAYAAICLHSIEEIHYLKSFFPRTFTVQEAFYAAAIELIKVAIIGIPFFLLIGICLMLLQESKKEKGS
ncbi:MAG: hypothetical protein ACM34I_09640 [bacterium]